MNTILVNMLEAKTRRKVKSKYANAPSSVELEEKFIVRSIPQQPENAPRSKIINVNMVKPLNL